MFEHLDDPIPFGVDEPLRRGVVARARRLRQRRRVVTTLTSVVMTVALVGVAGSLYVQRRDAAIDRIDLATAPSTDGATNILLVGNDARPAGTEPGVDSSRSDSIVVVRLEPDGSIDVLPIPSYLRDPSSGRALRDSESPQQLIDALTGLLGLPVDHYVQLDFAGFVEVIDDLGGVEVAIDVPLRDDSVGLDLQPSDCTTLDGDTALALVRSRRITGDTSGDFGRMARAQALITAAVAGLADTGTDPATIDRFSRTLADHALVDDRLSIGRLVEIGQQVAAAGPAGVDTSTLPVVTDQPPDGAPTVELAPPAEDVLRQFGTPEEHEIPTTSGSDTASTVPTEIEPGIGPCR